VLTIGSHADDVRKFVAITVGIFLIILVLLVGTIDKFTIGWYTLGRVWLAISMTAFSWLVIAHRLWKIWPFRMFLRVPVLQGTWTGNLQSNWSASPNGQTPLIPILFVIRQDLLSLTVLSFTKSRHGISQVARIIRNHETNTTKLAYIYSLCEEFRAGDGMQQGAAEVRAVGKRDVELRGEYWTNMNTRGRLILTRRSQQEVNSFDEAVSAYGSTPWKTFPQC
jgi:hypothetical protein